MDVVPPPAGWPRLSSALYCENPRAAIRFYCEAFGFSVRFWVARGEDGGAEIVSRELPSGDGPVEHSELTLGDGAHVAVIMVSASRKSDRPEWDYRRAPRFAGEQPINTQSLMLYVDDVDAHFARASRAGATIIRPPKTVDYGEGFWVDRGYEAADPEGHHFWFYQRLQTR